MPQQDMITRSATHRARARRDLPPANIDSAPPATILPRPGTPPTPAYGPGHHPNTNVPFVDRSPDAHNDRDRPDSGSPLARQRFCDLSTPGSATLTSPIAFSSRPGLWSPMSAACCKRLDEPAGSSCRQPTALKTEPHNGQRSSRSAGRGVRPRLGRPALGRSVEKTTFQNPPGVAVTPGRRPTPVASRLAVITSAMR
jgi:hypothetical protein